FKSGLEEESCNELLAGNLFFFSSRRRHTRSYGDWSSDVCSSDLLGAEDRPLHAWVEPGSYVSVALSDTGGDGRPHVGAGVRAFRSEERRVGKEGEFKRALEEEPSNALLAGNVAATYVSCRMWREQ